MFAKCLFSFNFISLLSLTETLEIQINRTSLDFQVNSYETLRVYPICVGPSYENIFVRGHYLFRETNSFPLATFSKNCLLLGTDNVQGQISAYIFVPNRGYCVYYPTNLFHSTHSFENWGIPEYNPPF